MAELADALDSGSSERRLIQVQVLLSAPSKHNKKERTNTLFFVALLLFLGCFLLIFSYLILFVHLPLSHSGLNPTLVHNARKGFFGVYNVRKGVFRGHNAQKVAYGKDML